MYLKNSKNLIIIALIAVLIIPVLVLFYINYNDKHFRCDAEYSATSDGYFLVSKGSLVINGEHGMLMIDGRISDSQDKVSFFKLRTYFEVEKNNFSYNFNSLNVSISSKQLNNSNILGKFFSDVLIKEGVSSFFYIYSLKENYIIASGNMPLLFCLKH